MTTAEPAPIRLEDYTPPDFVVDTVSLDFDLHDRACTVRARLALRRRPSADARAPLVLDGQALSLRALELDGEPLPASAYRLDAEALTIPAVPDRFELAIETGIEPHLNTALEGLYRSGGMFCTQCEAEGFRRITYYPDRPDVMARFTTRIEADRASYPVLLSNGNAVEAGESANGRHWVRWEDPFPKPSYLFALVAGDLKCHADTFRTRSGREVALEIFVEPHNIDKCGHAMESLKRAMAWDESTFGLEYDLDTFMIVAVDDFNMGAMENKGLNIFNSKYVLADPRTATDSDYEGIESVIAHEYFHNWTGNRVTCRDWFQLSLKEGLTVFRDQEFTGDVRSRAVKRIGDVRVLRNAQFKEDAGPMAHPVRPASYLEINNFYTVTVYNKGAEVIRMMHRLLGAAGFRRGMDLYFERHDGQAVTTDDFVAAMEDASGVDLGQFRRWYSQAGTPRIAVEETFDEHRELYRLTLRQSCAPTADGSPKAPFHIPVALGLLDGGGQPLAVPESILEMTEPTHTFTYRGAREKPVVSLLRGFSAPVRLDFERPDRELAFLMQADPDAFNRWEAGQELALRMMLRMIEAGGEGPVDPGFVEALGRTLADPDLDRALVAEMLVLPTESYLADQCDVIDVETIHRVHRAVRNQLARALEGELRDLLDSLTDNAPYHFETQSAARRALRNVALGYLMELGHSEIHERCVRQLHDADNMTDQFAALANLAHRDLPERGPALARFETEWRGEPLVMDKWLAIQASAPLPGTLDQVERLMGHPAFDPANPNRIRALIGTFCHQNQLRFHAGSGEGYRFLGRQIESLDSRNPQIAARLAGAFSRWRRFPSASRDAQEQEMRRLLGLPGLSRDCYDILSRSLA